MLDIITRKRDRVAHIITGHTEEFSVETARVGEGGVARGHPL